MEKVGKVVFAGYTYGRVKEMLGAPIEDLSPAMAVTVPYIMKAAQSDALANGPFREAVRRSVHFSMCNPLFRALAGGNQLQHMEEALMHSINFAWHYLVESGLIKHNGAPTLKSSIVDKLFYLVPNCFILANLIGDVQNPGGGLQTLSRNVGSSELKGRLIQMLIYLLQPVPVGNDKRALDDLHPDLKSAWHSYNEQVLDLLVNYGICQGERISERGLPLGGPCFPRTALIRDGQEDQAIQEWLSNASLTYHARSAFAAISGLGDDFLSIKDIELSGKEGLFVHRGIIPAGDPHHHVLRTVWEVIQQQRLDIQDAEWNNDYVLETKTMIERFDKQLRSVEVCLEGLKSAFDDAIRANDLALVGEDERATKRGRYIISTFLDAIKEAEKKIRVAQSLAVDGPGVMAYVPCEQPKRSQGPRGIDFDQEEEDDREETAGKWKEEDVRAYIFDPRVALQQFQFLDQRVDIKPADVATIKDAITGEDQWKKHEGQRIEYTYDRAARKHTAETYREPSRKMRGTAIDKNHNQRDPKTRRFKKPDWYIEFDHSQDKLKSLWLDPQNAIVPTTTLKLYRSAFRLHQPINYYHGAPVTFDLELFPKGEKCPTYPIITLYTSQGDNASTSLPVHLTHPFCPWFISLLHHRQ